MVNNVRGDNLILRFTFSFIRNSASLVSKLATMKWEHSETFYLQMDDDENDSGIT
jgi:hypothetical protein